MNRLVGLILPDRLQVASANLAVVAFAQQYSRTTKTPFDLLVVSGIEEKIAQEKWLHYGAERVFLASGSELTHAQPQAVAEICASASSQAGGISLAGPATRFGVDTLAAFAGLFGLPMLTSVCGLEEVGGKSVFQTICAARRQRVQVDTDKAVFSICHTAFGAPERVDRASKQERIAIDPAQLKVGLDWVENLPMPDKPLDLASARVVVAGGRALGDAESFKRLIGGLAEKLGGVPAATGVAVQAGISPKEMLVGQTGQTVSPDLYIAAGISGSDQHTGGMRGSRIIVAINVNPNATIFRMADYGLVADVHQALPELIEKL